MRTYMLHGHIHKDICTDFWALLRKKDRFLNAGVDLSGFEHGKIEEMIRKNGMLKENQAGRIKGSLGEWPGLFFLERDCPAACFVV